MRNIKNIQAVYRINSISNLTRIKAVLISIIDDIIVSYTTTQIVLI